MHPNTNTRDELEEFYKAAKAALFSGATSVTYGDKTVNYRSLTELKEVVRMIEAELFPERQPRSRRLAEVDRGYFPER